MAKKLVKCLYCGVTFDANVESFVKPRTNRYAHTECHEKHEANKTKEERDYEALVDYIKHLFGATPNPRVWKQLKEYKETYNFSYSGIHKTLKWWFEVKGKSLEDAHGGIGIVPYVYQDACNYYYAIYLATLNNENKDVAQCITKVREFLIEPPRIERRPPRLFNLDYDEEEDEV